MGLQDLQKCVEALLQAYSMPQRARAEMLNACAAEAYSIFRSIQQEHVVVVQSVLLTKGLTSRHRLQGFTSPVRQAVVRIYRHRHIVVGGGASRVLAGLHLLVRTECVGWAQGRYPCLSRAASHTDSLSLPSWRSVLISDWFPLLLAPVTLSAHAMVSNCFRWRCQQELCLLFSERQGAQWQFASISDQSLSFS
eukprot:TRINITY_DN10342_c0_g1_i2.p1 TRINITY_DN10342_c0_g1~~TRINITY_DN10342_c0_g1_i2.p1  ORF type:complete len:218 (+),score=7.79 TRINITY_DN10342_c0_g1_i2:74-655(+)